MDKKSIMTAHVTTAQTPPSNTLIKAAWNVERFNGLINNHGYHAFIERALRCPCVDKATGQALSTCKNCLGRGWFFVDKRETTIVAQSMANLRKNSDTGEINHGTARITTRAIDKLGFMDKIILTELEAYYSEILKPFMYHDELIAYPVYEPLSITNIYLFLQENRKLMPLKESQYEIIGNRIKFDTSILDLVEVTDINCKSPEVSISIRYAYNPVYHVVDANRELTKVRELKGGKNDRSLTEIPISVTARKAHYIFDAQRYGAEMFDNSVIDE